MKLCLTTALLLCSISSANANTCPLSNCNTLHAGEHYSINADGKYCINFNKENITVVNLSSRYIEIEDKIQIQLLYTLVNLLMSIPYQQSQIQPR